MKPISPRRLFVNALTFSRVPLIFAWAALAVSIEYAWCRAGGCVPAKYFGIGVSALVCLVSAAVSDLFDGMLARKWNVVSVFGKMADPLMDKVFFIVVFPTLMWMAGLRSDADPFHFFLLFVFTVMYILRDVWVTFLRSVASACRAEVGAMWLGKVRTALSFPAAGFVYLYFFLSAAPVNLPATWARAMRGTCFALEIGLLVLNVWSFWVYTKAYMPCVRTALSGDDA